MTQTKLSRRAMMQLSAATGAATFFAGLFDPAMAAGRDTLTIRTNRALASTDPGYMVGGTDIILQFACLARLVNYKESGTEWGWEPAGDYVNALTVSDDGKAISFELKPGINWYDAATHEKISELSAEDVKYSLERIAESAWDVKAAELDHVEVTGTHTGVIHLKSSFAPIFTTWLADGTGSILCKSAVEAAGGKFDGLFGFYCGAYRVSDWKPKQSFTLEANPNWSGTVPAIKTVKYIIIEDAKASELAYEAGEVDITEISNDTLARYKRDGIPAGSRVETYPGVLWQWMGMNTEHPKLQDIRVRRAIQHTVDTDLVIEGAFANIPARSRGVIPPGLIGHRTETKFERPDLDAARALIAEAGAEGLELTLQVENITERLATAAIIQANLAEIGINVEIIPLDPGPFWNLGVEAAGDDWKDLQLWLMRYGDSPDPSQMTNWYTSAQKGVWHWERWTDEEYDELNRKAMAETDDAKRHEMYIRMQEIMEDTGAYVWLMHEPLAYIMKEDLNVSIRPSGTLWTLAHFSWDG